MSNDLQQGTAINGPPCVGFSQHFRANCVVLLNGIKLMSGIDPEPEIYLKILLKLTVECTSIMKSYIKNIIDVLLTLYQQCKRF